MKRICVYCGSNPGNEPDYMDGAAKLGRILAENGIELVYGGAKVGLMGAVADAVLDHGGSAIGVIPAMLEREVAHPGLTELHVTATMHERKAKMFELSDAFIALPGGLGTLEELFEIMTWSQLGSHGKPCGLLNIMNYYEKLMDFLSHTADQGFLHRNHLDIIASSHDPETLLDHFRSYTSPSDRNMDKLSLFREKGRIS